MVENIKFSILVPTYKSKFLDECIKSILSQTYTNFELVIVNDHSPENITEIVRKYNDSRIKYYVNKSNCGAINVVDNWNICLEYATGEYTLCMGDDDALLPNCLFLYKQYIDKYPSVNVLHMRTQLINEQSKVLKTLEERPIQESSYEILLGRWKGRRQFIGDFLYKTSTLKSDGGFVKIPMGLASDDLTAIYQAKDKGCVNINTPGFLYRDSDMTISNNGRCEVLLKAIGDIERHLDTILDWKVTSENLDVKTELLQLRKKHKQTLQYSVMAHSMASKPWTLCSMIAMSMRYKINIFMTLKAFLSGCYHFLKN